MFIKNKVPFLTCRMLSMAWTPRSRFKPPQRTHSMQATTPGRVGGARSCVGAEAQEKRETGGWKLKKKR